MSRFLIFISAWLLAVPSPACELLVKAVDAVHSEPGKDARGSYKRGMVVVAMPDGHQWGARESLPTFVVIKLPGITVAKAIKYIAPQLDATTNTVRRRLWQIQVADIPLAARNKLLTTGSLTIGPTGDYTWVQFRNFIKNLETGLTETNNL